MAFPDRPEYRRVGNAFVLDTGNLTREEERALREIENLIFENKVNAAMLEQASTPYIPLGDPGYRRKDGEHFMPMHTLTNSAPSKVLPTWKSTPIPRITEYLITFIGGPYNATQRQVEVSSIPYMTDGNVCKFLDMEYPTYAPGEPADLAHVSFAYKTVFIPSAQTPFTDAQCVVAVFVP